MERIAKGAIILFQLIGVAIAQTPTGSIAGVVRDASGAAMEGSPVKVVNASMGLARTIATSATGDYNFPSLLAGEYEVRVEASGFHSAIRNALVDAGETTIADFNMAVGDLKESVTVDAAASGAYPFALPQSSSESGFAGARRDTGLSARDDGGGLDD